MVIESCNESIDDAKKKKNNVKHRDQCWISLYSEYIRYLGM